MKKLTLKVLSLLMMLLMLCGCCRIDMDVHVLSGSRIKTEGTMYISQVQLDQLGKDIEDFRSLMVGYGLDFLDEDYSFATRSFDGNTYQGISFTSYESEFFEVTSQNETVTLLIHDPKENLEISVANTNGKSLAEFMESVNVEANLTVHMPGKIIIGDPDETSARTVNINPLEVNEDIIITSHTALFDFLQALTIILGTVVVILMYAYPIRNKLKKDFPKRKI